MPQRCRCSGPIRNLEKSLEENVLHIPEPCAVNVHFNTVQYRNLITVIFFLTGDSNLVLPYAIVGDEAFPLHDYVETLCWTESTG